MRVASPILSTDQPRSRARKTDQIRRSLGETRRRWSWPASLSSPVASDGKSRPLRPSSSERIPLRNASLNVRPIAIASPTDFICVVRVRSACGNFSNVQRGILTTT